MKPPKSPKVSVDEDYNFCFWYYDGKRWKRDQNIVTSNTALEARELLRKKVGEEKYNSFGYPCRVIFA